MVAGSTFKIAEVKPDLTKEEPRAFILRGIADLLDQKIEHFKMFAWVNGQRILAPAIDMIVVTANEIIVMAHQIHIYKACVHNGCGILYKNIVLKEMRTREVHALNGDTVRWSYHIHLAGDLLTVNG